MTILGTDCDCRLNQQGNFSSGEFRVWAIRLLMKLADLVSSVVTLLTTPPTPTPSTAPVFAAEQPYGFASITAAWTTAGVLYALTHEFVLDNQTNGDIQISFDGGVNVYMTMRGGDKRIINLQALGRIILVSTNVSITRSSGGTTPTAGSFRIQTIQ